MKSELTLLAATLCSAAAIAVPAEAEDVYLTEVTGDLEYDADTTVYLTSATFGSNGQDASLYCEGDVYITGDGFNLFGSITATNVSVSGTTIITAGRSTLTVYDTLSLESGGNVTGCGDWSFGTVLLSGGAGLYWMGADSLTIGTLSVSGDGSAFSTVGAGDPVTVGSINVTDGGSVDIAEVSLWTITGSVYVDDSSSVFFCSFYGEVVISADTGSVVFTSATEDGIQFTDTEVITISADEEYLASLVAGTAVEIQIFDENIFPQVYESEIVVQLSDVWDLLEDYEASYDAETGILTITVIPEQSAFGFLAGIAVLAFTALRRSRRRSRKIA